MDKLGGGLSGGHTETGKTQEHHQAVTSGTQVQGNLTLTAGKTLSQEGVSHTVGGAYTETAQNSAHGRLTTVIAPRKPVKAAKAASGSHWITAKSPVRWPKPVKILRKAILRGG